MSMFLNRACVHTSANAARTSAQCRLVLWGGTPIPQPTPSPASPDLVDCTSSRARAPDAAQGSRPTKNICGIKVLTKLVSCIKQKADYSGTNCHWLGPCERTICRRPIEDVPIFQAHTLGARLAMALTCTRRPE